MSHEPDVVRVKNAGAVARRRMDRLHRRGVDCLATFPEIGVIRLSWVEDGVERSVRFVEAS